jgi:hypothetical protein
MRMVALGTSPLAPSPRPPSAPTEAEESRPRSPVAAVVMMMKKKTKTHLGACRRCCSCSSCSPLPMHPALRLAHHPAPQDGLPYPNPSQRLCGFFLPLSISGSYPLKLLTTHVNPTLKLLAPGLQALDVESAWEAKPEGGSSSHRHLLSGLD